MTEKTVVFDPSRDTWAEMKPGVWLRKDDSAMRIVVERPSEFAWQTSIPVGFGSNSGRVVSGTAKTLATAQAKALAATRRDDEANLRYRERMAQFTELTR